MESSSSDVSLHIGNLFNWFLYGVLTVQLYLYYVAFPHDRLLHKTVVGIVYFLETVHSIGLAVGLEIMMLAVLQLATVIAALSCMPVFPVYIWIGLTVINDIIIAVVMVRALANSRGFSQETAQKTMRPISLIVETGCATAAVNLLSLIFVATMGRIGDVYSAPLIILSKVYANSIMVLLNNRISIVGSRNAAPPPIQTIDISRVSEYNTMQGLTLTNSKNPFMH
ncbi:hypothetical protein APHAL10511_006668 [Amanita phalloides]|nr:hypothetical protein APHAL10511_006668 [Amanita phalloides]